MSQQPEKPKAQEPTFDEMFGAGGGKSNDILLASGELDPKFNPDNWKNGQYIGPISVVDGDRMSLETSIWETLHAQQELGNIAPGDGSLSTNNIQVPDEVANQQVAPVEYDYDQFSEDISGLIDIVTGGYNDVVEGGRIIGDTFTRGTTRFAGGVAGASLGVYELAKSTAVLGYDAVMFNTFMRTGAIVDQSSFNRTAALGAGINYAVNNPQAAWGGVVNHFSGEFQGAVNEMNAGNNFTSGVVFGKSAFDIYGIARTLPELARGVGYLADRTAVAGQRLAQSNGYSNIWQVELQFPATAPNATFGMSGANIKFRSPIANKGDFTVAKHGDMPSPRPGQHSHHGVMSAWMKKNYPEYKPNQAPAVLMPDVNHRATFGVYNTWRAEARKGMGGIFDWGKVPETQMKKLSDKMFDTAKVPSKTQQEYWDWYSRMITALNK